MGGGKMHWGRAGAATGGEERGGGGRAAALLGSRNTTATKKARASRRRAFSREPVIRCRNTNRRGFCFWRKQIRRPREEEHFRLSKVSLKQSAASRM